MAVWQNLIIQLGISALVLFVVYKIGLKLLANQRAADEERAKSAAESERERNKVFQEGFRSIVDTQLQFSHGLQRIMMWCNSIGGQLATVLDLTPVKMQMPTMPPTNASSTPASPPTVIVEDHDDTPVDRPVDRPSKPVVKRESPVHGTPIVSGGAYGPIQPSRRPKTSGGDR